MICSFCSSIVHKPMHCRGCGAVLCFECVKYDYCKDCMLEEAKLNNPRFIYLVHEAGA